MGCYVWGVGVIGVGKGGHGSVSLVDGKSTGSGGVVAQINQKRERDFVQVTLVGFGDRAVEPVSN